MADLKQALIWLAEGKKIMIPDWENNCYLYLCNTDNRIYDEQHKDFADALNGNNWELFKDGSILSEIEEFSVYDSMIYIASILDKLTNRIQAIENHLEKKSP